MDADIGLRNLDLLLGLENRVMYTAMEVLEGECRMEQALIRDKRWRSLALLPISKNRQKAGEGGKHRQTAGPPPCHPSVVILFFHPRS